MTSSGHSSLKAIAMPNDATARRFSVTQRITPRYAKELTAEEEELDGQSRRETTPLDPC